MKTQEKQIKRIKTNGNEQTKTYKNRRKRKKTGEKQTKTYKNG